MGLPTIAKVGIGWTLTVGVGIYSFILSKKDINARRYERMKERRRLKNANLQG